MIDAFLSSLPLLAADPFRSRPGLDVKRLRGVPHTYRLRVGSWRATYTIGADERRVRVTSAAPRGRAYR